MRKNRDAETLTFYLTYASRWSIRTCLAVEYLLGLIVRGPRICTTTELLNQVINSICTISVWFKMTRDISIENVIRRTFKRVRWPLYCVFCTSPVSYRVSNWYISVKHTIMEVRVLIMDKRSPHSAHQRREINKALRPVGERIRAKIGRIDIWEALAVDVVKDKRHFLKVSYGVVVGNAVRNGVKAVAI